MLTQAMPSLARSLNGAISPQALRAMMQSVGNCGQDVVQRAGVFVAPGLRPVYGPSFGGSAGPGQNPSGEPGWFSYPDSGWNPGTTVNITIPPGSDGEGNWIPVNTINNNVSNDTANYFVDMPGGGGYRAGDWFATNYGSPQYAFNTNIANELNSFFGGPTNYFGGNTYIPNLITNNITVFGDDRTGVPGSPGLSGAPGPPGGDGAEGARGQDGRIGFFRAAGPPGDDGRDGADGDDGPAGPPGQEGVIEYVPRMPKRRKFVAVDVDVRRLPVVTDVKFNSDTCALTVTRNPFVAGVNAKRDQLLYYGPNNGLGEAGQ